VPKGQIEAATAFGMSKSRVFRRILFPQALRLAIPGLGNLWLTLMKATSITSVIGLTELARQADLIKNPTHAPFTVYFIACLFYLLITAISDVVRLRIDHWASAGFRRI
jgi:polar amino acid transport system permease protein/octopine/nopaline transport system permease protein/arginine/ornithine transport system permease protein